MKGKILGSRYQVLEYIAEGGFGQTYLAADTQLPDRDLCVLKQLSPGFNTPKLLEIARRLFKTEAATLHSLGHHPQIPELLAYFEEAEKFYLVQQYIRGKTIDTELSSTQVWSASKVVEFLRDCLHVLQYIHEQGVIHRDIKPANLIRRHSDSKIVLVDFGTVKNILQEQTSLSQLTVAVGTQGYMPIEQARGKPSSTSDLYALGIIGIQALTGIEPLNLEEDRHGEIIWSHLADTNHRLKDILTKMTRCHYLDRYQSARTVLEAIDSCTDTVITFPPQAIAVTPVRELDHSPAPKNEPINEVRNEPISDPNALPGVRSVSLSTLATQQSRAKLTLRKLGKIAIAIMIILSSLYLVSASVLKPNNPYLKNIRKSLSR